MGLKLIGEVALDGSGFERGLNRLASGAVSSFKSTLVQAFGIYGIQQAISKTIDAADELVTASKRIGVGVEQLQVLRQAAKDNNTELDTLIKAFERLDVAREKALRGGKAGEKTIEAFGKLGINEDQLRSQTAAQLFLGPIKLAAGQMSQEDLGPVLREVIGRSFGEVIPILSEDFDALRKKMESIGAIMSSETAVALDKLGDEFSLLSQIIVSQVGPALLKFVEVMYQGALKIGQQVGGVAASVGAGTAQMGIGDLVKKLPSVFTIGVQGLYKQLAQGMSTDDVKKFIKERMTAIGYDVKAAELGTKSGEAPWLKKQDEFSKLLADLAKQADELRKPKPPQFDVEAEVEKPTRRKTMQERGDALTRVGNFLGSSRDVLADIATRQVTLLQQIVENTRPSASSSGELDFPID